MVRNGLWRSLRLQKCVYIKDISSLLWPKANVDNVLQVVVELGKSSHAFKNRYFELTIVSTHSLNISTADDIVRFLSYFL